ncbi:hypothetical protein M3Y94_01022700 [Aphelenchoides besseyi]|nr:hypothetical protein M3Y94_01022700 [Aphelenchoides besseyi]KAI6216340.1 hypothetical protein M3Y95_01282300 [Aphelenchoides besseyi]
MKTLSSLLLLALVHLSLQAPVITEEPCTSVNETFTVDKVSFGTYTTARYHRGLYNEQEFLLLVPKVVFDSVTDQLNAQVVDSLSIVKCDNQSLITYPDLIYTVNGVNIVLHPSDYIDTEQSLFYMCVLLIDYMEDIAEDYDYVVSYVAEDQLCRAQKGPNAIELMN